MYWSFNSWLVCQQGTPSRLDAACSGILSGSPGQAVIPSAATGLVKTMLGSLAASAGAPS